MLKNEKDQKIITDFILNTAGDKTKPWLEQESEAIIEQMKQFNHRQKFYDPDIARWTKEHMSDHFPIMSIQDFILLREMTKENSIHMWARRAGKTRFARILAAYEALSNAKHVIVLSAFTNLMSADKLFLDSGKFSESIASRESTSHLSSITFNNGGKLTLLTEKGIINLKEHTESAMYRGEEAQQPIHIIADDFDAIKSEKQKELLDSISRIASISKGLFTIISTPFIHKEDGVQVFTPLQKVIKKYSNESKYFYDQRAASPEMMKMYEDMGYSATYSKEQIISEIEGSFDLAEPSILLGE